MSLFSEERKFGECPHCKELKLMDFYIATRNGKLVSGWMCSKCINEAKEGSKA